MKNILFIIAFVIAFTCTSFAQGGYAAQSTASYVTSVTPASCGYAGQSCLFGRYSSIAIYPTGGTNFPATCSSSVPWGNTAYCDVRIKITYGSNVAYAYLTYVSPTQINFMVPPIWNSVGSGSTAGTSRYFAIQDGTNSWNTTHARYDNILNIAAQSNVAYRYDESDNWTPYANGVVYGWNGSAYVVQRAMVDTACTDTTDPSLCTTPTAIPKTYNGQPTILVFFGSGAWDLTDNNPSGETITLTIDGNNHNLTVYNAGGSGAPYDQVNWTVPSGATTGTKLGGYFDHTGLQYPNTWYLKFQ